MTLWLHMGKHGWYGGGRLILTSSHVLQLEQRVSDATDTGSKTMANQA